MDSLARTLVIVGLTFVALGILVHVLPGIPGLGRLPGDLRIERPGVRIYVPIATSLLLSLVVSLGFWLFSKLR